MELSVYIPYLLIIVISTYLIRTIPFVLINKKIENRFIRSFLYYIPFAVLTAMTIPAIFSATSSYISATIGLITAICLSLWGRGLTTVALISTLSVFITETVIGLIK
ncbi:MAG TPA: branched-chain amino acid transporter [Lachnospiraceae bacterium]|nr:branched-chain amino acid transporter [Lachnospiraceae bacterium]